MNSKFDECAECNRKESGASKLTWQMSREDITIRNEGDLRVWMKRREGLPSVMVLPDSGGILVYSVAPYCDCCLDKHLKEYEEGHTPSGETTRAKFQERVVNLFRHNGWTVYFLQHDHLAPRGFPNLALLKDDQLLLRSLRGDVTVQLRAFHPSAGTVVISPETPQEVREVLATSKNGTH